MLPYPSILSSLFHRAETQSSEHILGDQVPMVIESCGWIWTQVCLTSTVASTWSQSPQRYREDCKMGGEKSTLIARKLSCLMPLLTLYWPELQHRSSAGSSTKHSHAHLSDLPVSFVDVGREASCITLSPPSCPLPSHAHSVLLWHTLPYQSNP